MLSPNSAPVIRATLPIVGAALPEITARFYDTMFADHPELLDGLFNRANQANGTQRTALAGAIAAFAGMLVEHPDQRPDAMLARIAHKHASLGITADQYRIVHTYLFGAIAEVLGEAVTAEVAAAWDEVYWLMANALIALEARLYAESGVAGHDTRRPWRVVERRTETDDVVSFTLKPEDAAPVPAFRPGQYVTVSVRLDDDTTQLRQYSVSGAPGGDLRRISVKRVHGDGSPEGEVSNWLHANLAAGDLLTVSAPFGDVTLDEGSAPLVLASAGIGCTPMIAMLEHLVATGSTRPVTVVHADRSPAHHALRTELAELVPMLPDAALHVWYEQPAAGWPAARTGRVDLTGVPIPTDGQAYLCGPLPFMRAVRSSLLDRGLPASAISYEVFGPDLWLSQD